MADLLDQFCRMGEFFAPKHLPNCPAPATDYEEKCTCPRCEMCREPSQGKQDSEGIEICDECWPHLERDYNQITK